MNFDDGLHFEPVVGTLYVLQVHAYKAKTSMSEFAGSSQPPLFEVGKKLRRKLRHIAQLCICGCMFEKIAFASSVRSGEVLQTYGLTGFFAVYTCTLCVEVGRNSAKKGASLAKLSSCECMFEK